MVIGKLGVDAPVSAFGLDSNNVPEVPLGADAPEVVAWYNFSAKPGIGSNAVFAGHVTWNGPAVFFNLTSVAAGDEIKLVGQDGSELLYQVIEVYSVNPSDPESLSVMHATHEDVITIITCDGTFTDTNDPVFGGDYSARLVVRAARANPSVALDQGG
jgi:LPXTG-site transpeptidase (sortase) family protein